MMAFPDPERFTFEDIATRWGKSLNYVREHARTGTLKASCRIQRRIRTSDSTGKQFPVFKMVHYVERKELCAFEERFGIRVNEVYQATHENADSQKLPRLAKNTYSIPEAAEYLGRHPSTIRRWIDEGQLDASGPEGAQRRISRDSLLAAENPPE